MYMCVSYFLLMFTNIQTDMDIKPWIFCFWPFIFASNHLSKTQMTGTFASKTPMNKICCWSFHSRKLITWKIWCSKILPSWDLTSRKFARMAYLHVKILDLGIYSALKRAEYLPCKSTKFTLRKVRKLCYVEY